LKSILSGFILISIVDIVVAIDKELNFNANTEGEIEVDFERKLLLANAAVKIYALVSVIKERPTRRW
jgi:hypothetical protein